MATKRADWLAGSVVGVAGGLCFWLFPALAGLLPAVVAILASRRPTRRWTLSGLLIGAGATWHVILLQAVVRCASFDSAAGQECIQPDLTPWLVVATVVVGVGLAMLVSAARQHR